jgi:hypothetical protein
MSAWRDVANVDEIGRAARRWGPMGDHMFVVLEIMLLRMFGLGRRTALGVRYGRVVGCVVFVACS